MDKWLNEALFHVYIMVLGTGWRVTVMQTMWKNFWRLTEFVQKKNNKNNNSNSTSSIHIVNIIKFIRMHDNQPKRKLEPFGQIIIV